MAARDWTPSVIITAMASLATVLVVWVAAPDGASFDARRPNRPRRHAPTEVAVWVGDIAPDVRAVLAPVWGDPGADRDHDAALNKRLGLGGDQSLTFFRLMLFNVGGGPHRFKMGEGLVTVDVGETRALRSVWDMVERGSLTLTDDLRFSLKGLGLLARDVEIPPSQMVNLVVAFDAGTSLGKATSVHTVKGGALRRRQMTRERLHALMERPDEERIRNL